MEAKSLRSMEKIEIIGNLKRNSGSWDSPQRGIVYGVNGLCGCLNGMEFRNNHPKILIYGEDQDKGSDREGLCRGR